MQMTRDLRSRSSQAAWLRRACLGLLGGGALALGGCQTDQQQSGGGFPSLSIMASDDEPMPHLTSVKSQHTLAFVDTPSQGALTSVDSKDVALRLPRMQAYLQSILDDLSSHWDGDMPGRIGVFITANNSFNAYTTPENDILVSLDAIDKVQTEDELAALLGHELGHVLLKHMEDERAARSIVQIGTAAAAVAGAAAIVSRMETSRSGNTTTVYLPTSQQGAVNRDLLKTTAALSAGITLVSDIGVSAYSRHQENVADRFAIELLKHADYDPGAIRQVLEYIRSAEEEAKKQKVDYEIQARDFGGVITEVVSHGMAQLGEAITKSHPTAESRLQKTGQKLRAIMKDSQAPERRSKRLMQAKQDPQYRAALGFYRELYRHVANPTPENARKLLRLLSTPFGRTALARTIAFPVLFPDGGDIAYKLMKTASEVDRAPPNYFVFLSSAEAKRMDAAGTKRTIGRMGSRFGWEVTYPVAIRRALELGDAEWLEELSSACAAQANRQVKSECDKARAGHAADAEYRAPGGIFRTFMSSVSPANTPAHTKGIASNGGVQSTAAQVFSNLFGQ